MANVIAVPSKGCIVRASLTASPIAYQTIAHQGTINGLSLSVKMEDVTQQDSGSPWRDYVPTLLEPGAISLDIFAQPDPADVPSGNRINFKQLTTWFTGRGLTTPGEPIPFELVFSDAALTVWKFNAFVQDLKMTESVDGVIKAAMTLKATGEVTFP